MDIINGDDTAKCGGDRGSEWCGEVDDSAASLAGYAEGLRVCDADVIARGLSAFEPENVAITAGRIMLTRLNELAAGRESFAFETTLASRSFSPWIAGLRKEGYRFHLVYIWLDSADLAVARVAQRVRSGGHHVPEETIRRRYLGGIENFFELYGPITDSWQCYHNIGSQEPAIIATGRGTHYERIRDKKAWAALKQARRRG